MPVVGTHEPTLVVLSILIAAAASFSSLDLAGRVRAASGMIRLAWLTAAAVVMGGGIWSMHFVAMMAFSMPGIEVHYDIGLTMLSLALPIVVTGLGFFTVDRKDTGPAALAISGVLMGAGIAAMHYTGMAAMWMSADLSYDALWVSFSILIAVGASAIALWITFRYTNFSQKFLAAGVMGLAVSGMHYAAMRAAIFTTGKSVDEAQGHPSFGQIGLAMAVLGTNFVLLLVASAAAAYDRRLSILMEREQAARRESKLAQAHAAANVQLLAVTARAEQASHAKSDFLSTMSHELRTPMTGVLGIIDLLSAEDLPGQQRRYVDALRVSGRHLLNVINDILDFSRMETGKLELEHIDFSLPVLLEELRTLLNPQAVERGLDLRFELSEHSPLVLKGDPTRLKQVLLNLAGNGIKFTEKGSVTVSVSHQPLDGQRIRLRFDVRDSGIGIAPEKRAELFTAFTQADRSVARRFGGSGLGLAISKRLVEAMAGEIGVNSILGLGSIFWFEVPLDLGDQVNLERAARVQFTKAQSRRILVAEDIDINRALLQDVLTRQGHQLAFAENGVEAVALVEKEPFDLILMDVQMPVMDGIEATRRIRELDRPVRDIPILALTATVLAQERKRYLEAGMTDCLMKPIDWDQLQAAISRYGDNGQAAAPSEATIKESGEASLVDRQTLKPLKAIISSDELASLIRRTIEDAERCHARMVAATIGSDELTREAHSLKGTSGTLGLTRVSQIAAEIEEKARDGGETEHLAVELKNAIVETRDELQRLCHGNRAGRTKL